jgi:hypothetical protein
MHQSVTNNKAPITLFFQRGFFDMKNRKIIIIIKNVEIKTKTDIPIKRKEIFDLLNLKQIPYDGILFECNYNVAYVWKYIGDKRIPPTQSISV